MSLSGRPPEASAHTAMKAAAFVGLGKRRTVGAAGRGETRHAGKEPYDALPHLFTHLALLPDRCRPTDRDRDRRPAPYPAQDRD